MNEDKLYRIFYAVVKEASETWLFEVEDPVAITNWIEGVVRMTEEVKKSISEQNQSEQEGID